MFLKVIVTDLCSVYNNDNNDNNNDNSDDNDNNKDNNMNNNNNNRLSVTSDYECILAMLLGWSGDGKLEVIRFLVHSSSETVSAI